MGYFNIPIKPSTILVFSIAFGISVDDTIHFLAKYRQELLASKWKVKSSVYAALRETGVSMFYTSIVLFFGFLVNNNNKSPPLRGSEVALQTPTNVGLVRFRSALMTLSDTIALVRGLANEGAVSISIFKLPASPSKRNRT